MTDGGPGVLKQVIKITYTPKKDSSKQQMHKYKNERPSQSKIRKHSWMEWMLLKGKSVHVYAK